MFGQKTGVGMKMNKWRRMTLSQGRALVMRESITGYKIV